MSKVSIKKTFDINENSKAIDLSVIIPFRNDPAIPHLMGRLEKTCQLAANIPNIEFIVSDSGSDQKSSEKIKVICKKYNIKYVYQPTRGQVFSIGSARDFGVIHASGRAVTFIDIDFRFPSDFWGRLIKFMDSYGTLRQKKSFFVVPILYLTQNGTLDFEQDGSDEQFASVFLNWFHGDTETVQNMAPCSSIIVVNRHHYLSVGGHRKEFRGHGYEDFELIHRLLLEWNVFPRADNYYKDNKAWDASTYNGFRAQFALLGRAAMMFNLFGVHLWHPRPKNTGFYNPSAMKLNRDSWIKYFQEFDKDKEHPEPLISYTVEKENFLFFGQPRTNNSRILRDIFPILGVPHYINEYDFINNEQEVEEDSIRGVIDQLGIRKMVFPNPYGNEARIAILKWCRKNNFPYLIFDRGALPYSWFFDDTGFNADSKRYNRNIWDKPLTPEEMQAVQDYVDYSLYHAESLEKQGDRIGPQALSTNLKVGGQKVLFVPLQRPSDSVIRHFSNEQGGFDKFISAIDIAAKKLSRFGWKVLVKKHPLEKSSPNLEFAQYVPDDTHFLDLIELADAVSLINSGVGIYAMMAGKPCYTFGRTFYNLDGVNKPVPDYDGDILSDFVLEGMDVDKETVLRFIYYLRNKFYSFGIPTVVEKKEADGSRRGLTRAIDFKEIRLPNHGEVLFAWETDLKVPEYSPIFERYKLHLFQKKEAMKKVPTPPKTVTRTPAPAPAAPAKAPVISTVSAVTVSKSTTGTRKVKLEKLRHKPRQFFTDSKFKILRPLKVFFPK